MTDFKFRAHFPLRDEISPISFICNDADDALDQWNRAREHDGLRPHAHIPRDTDLEVLQHDDIYEGVCIDYTDIDFATLLRLPETTDEQLEACEQVLLQSHDEGYSVDILDMSMFERTVPKKPEHLTRQEYASILKQQRLLGDLMR